MLEYNWFSFCPNSSFIPYHSCLHVNLYTLCHLPNTPIYSFIHYNMVWALCFAIWLCSGKRGVIFPTRSPFVVPISLIDHLLFSSSLCKENREVSNLSKWLWLNVIILIKLAKVVKQIRQKIAMFWCHVLLVQIQLLFITERGNEKTTEIRENLNWL